MWFHKMRAFLLVFSFIFPFCVLVGWVALNEYHVRVGQSLILPIEGYDPRDFLSGYYLTYKVRYGIKCPKKKTSRSPAYMCFKPKKHITFQKPKRCSLFLKGHCLKGDFSADIHRYYIPEKNTKQAEKLFIQAQKKQVKLSVSSTGKALVQDLLVDGKPLKKQLN